MIIFVYVMVGIGFMLDIWYVLRNLRAKSSYIIQMSFAY
jgi:hypothetical protein